MSKWLRFFLGLAALVTIVFGTHIEWADKIEWVADLFAPDHAQVLETYEHMLKTHEPIKVGDPGFREISLVVSDILPDSTDRKVASIRIFSSGTVKFGSRPREIIDVVIEVTFEDGSQTKVRSPDLAPEIGKRFLDEPLFRLGRLIFWAGVIFSLVLLIASLIYKTT